MQAIVSESLFLNESYWSLVVAAREIVGRSLDIPQEEGLAVRGV